MSNLSFDFAPDFRPLAARMRPETLEQFVGQQHILGLDKPLRRAIESGMGHSMILWGPPGTGKTTLAELLAKYCNAEVERLSAVTSGVKDIREATTHAKVHQQQGRKTLLFVDEVHRFNKSQQDAFLPHIEDGTFIFVGATTENPSFELNNALLSRVRVYRLQRLTELDIDAMVSQALSRDEQLKHYPLHFDGESRELLCKLVDGDGRKALNYLELLSDSAPIEQGVKRVDNTLLNEVTGERVARMDNRGDHYYDLISAFHKSVRGSSPEGALYWYARIVSAGGDPLYVARRLLAIASEDIGNADPRAMQVALAAWDCFERVGPAEGERAIAQAAVYCALAPKSNALYTAWKAALDEAQNGGDYEVPEHLRNAPTALMRDLGYGQSYRYAHDEPGAYAAGESYLPPELSGRRYYHPSERGFEKQLQQKRVYLDELDAASRNKRL